LCVLRAKIENENRIAGVCHAKKKNSDFRPKLTARLDDGFTDAQYFEGTKNTPNCGENPLISNAFECLFLRLYCPRNITI
jgi:hypothetical protein